VDLNNKELRLVPEAEDKRKAKIYTIRKLVSYNIFFSFFEPKIIYPSILITEKNF